MGFKIAYESLLAIFPQVDSRALRAVAIEHSEDADAAVRAVLEEIIPFFAERLKPGTPFACSSSCGESSEACALVGNKTVDGSSLNAPRRAELQNDCNVDTGNQELFNDADYKPNDPTCDGCHGDGTTTQLITSQNLAESKMKMSAAVHSPAEPVILTDEIGENTPLIEESGEPETKDTGSGDICRENNTKVASDNTVCPTQGSLQDVGSSVQLVEAPVMHESAFDKFRVSESTISSASNKAIVNSIISTENVSTSNAAMSQSNQLQAIDVLEEIIAHARNHKKTLFSAMESVTSLMREVELTEEAAEKAKEQAANGGTHILGKVEELERMLQHAKEANNMHAGEVYGEKAILATELKELQMRILSLIDERDTALGLLDEMHQTLEERLAAAQNAINLAEQEKIEKEEAAQKSFTDLELVLEKVAQESKVLKQQEEENSKLQEFLLDRGRVLDVLQGEIAVICQDVRLLKEKFDAGVPFSKSLYSSHTSFVLASSSSSSKTSIPDQVEPQEGRDHEKITEEEKAARDGPNSPLDDGWDVFDKHEIDA